MVEWHSDKGEINRWVYYVCGRNESHEEGQSGSHQKEER